MKTDFPDPADVLNFTLTIEPDEGMYKTGSFKFTFAINNNYPHDPPKVKCTQKVSSPAFREALPFASFMLTL